MSQEIKIEDIKDGDILKILGEDENGNQVDWFAEKVGVNADNMLEVYYIEPTDNNGNIWKYPDTEVTQLLTIESVQEHASSADGYKKAWRQLGFRYIRDENGQTMFIKEESEVNGTMHPIGEEDTDSESDESEIDSDIDSDMEEFIILDEEGEAFTIAQGDDEFVNETHSAVNKFNEWRPVDESEKKIKKYIQAIERGVVEAEDDRRFNLGLSPLVYSRPKTK